MMSEQKSDGRNDRVLGMDQPIDRRDFLNATLLASGGLLLNAAASPAQILGEDWTGYGGVGDYSESNGNTAEVINAGHFIRDHQLRGLPPDTIDTGETYDLVVVGGGISGLSAALFFQKRAGQNVTSLVIDNHAIFGGEAKGNDFLIDGKRLTSHQGSAFFPVPYPHSFAADFYNMIGLTSHRFEYQTWDDPSPELPLGVTPYGGGGPAYGFYFGAKFGHRPGVWLTDPWGKKLEGAPLPDQDRTELLQWNSRDNSEDRPVYEGDEISRRLDTITMEEHMIARTGISRQTIRKYLSSDVGSGYGLGPDALSAYCFYASSMLHSLPARDGGSQQMFPGGNAGIARLITKTLIPDSIPGQHAVEDVCRNRVNFDALDRPNQYCRIRLRSTAVWVKHENDPGKSNFVQVAYVRGGKTYLVKARSAVMAGGSWTTKHIIPDLPSAQREAYAQFHRSPCLMANVAVRNWRFLAKLGISGCRWFEGIGTSTRVRKLATFGAPSTTIGPDSPVVLIVKILFPSPGRPIAEQGSRGRAELLSTSFRDYERKLREQFSDMFSRSGFDPRNDIAGIILNRWGHAYVNPQPGFFFGRDGKPAPRHVLRGAPFGRIAFANTDLAGAADHRNSILEAHRAVDQLLGQVLTE